jgi:hypothetical protein
LWRERRRPLKAPDRKAKIFHRTRDGGEGLMSVD